MVIFWFIEMNYNIIEDSIEIIWELYLVAHLEKRYRPGSSNLVNTHFEPKT